jgi:hypothetical protein
MQKFYPTNSTFEKCVTHMSSLMNKRNFTLWILFPASKTFQTLLASVLPCFKCISLCEGCEPQISCVNEVSMTCDM